ncbi:transglutaminase-like cysteine peptidase [Chelativorans sp. AA-79]|uniref:transglutaminase-like cysteine peptidase n=1 Tax=Chelativorans sp. AA-79 TaxID=3028735 RepID=UPI0023F8C511|nr:transglutaminase-like cysteine peptidase [Chelativorans sp. AA-79]WEX08137.1 transglutaminase-like cysteine peptidase [Chelativorans sp. AA-79]
MAAKRAGFVAALILLSTAGIGASPAVGSGLMATGAVTSQPIGHYEFCRANPRECTIRPRDAGPLALSSALMARIEKINLAVNRAVKPLNDSEIYGKEEVWAYPNRGVGDCEDYVLEKRRLLNAAGISLSDLLITVVRKPDGEGHAVLTVRTNQGDLILDNLSDDVKLWSHTRYRFLKRQATTNTGQWVSLRDENNLLVGAVEK